MKRYLLPLLLVMTTPVFAGESALTGKTLIDRDVVTVGDLFTNAGKDAGHVLAPAPKAGDRLVLNKNDLMRVSDAFRLHWTPMNDHVTVVLERNATVIAENDIVAALNDSPLKHDVSTDAEFKVTNLLNPVIVQGRDKPELLVSNTMFNPESEAFHATLEIKRDGKLLETVSLEGVATPMAVVPMVTRTVISGTVLSAGDITETAMPKKLLRDDTILSKADLIGMTVRRAIQPDAAINQGDITPPVMVKRNEIITVTYKNGTMQLSTKARALSNGSLGDVLQLINPTSNKTFEAKVTGPQQAEVNLEG